MIEEVLLGVSASLVASTISATTEYVTLDILKKRKIKNRVENAVVETIEPLIPFLKNENISEKNQELLINTCRDELTPFTEDSTKLFENSLNGQVLYDSLYEDGLPQVIVAEGLESIYSILFPRIATVLCQIPSAVKDWEANAWKANYGKLDDIAMRIRDMFEQLDSSNKRKVELDDDLFRSIVRDRTQRVKMDLDLAGLRADKAFTGKIEDFFVHPEIIHTEQNEVVHKVKKSKESLTRFVQESRYAIIYGDPGAGKSTWARWLEAEALSDKWYGLAVRVELRGLASTGELPSVHKLIRSSISQHFRENVSADKIREWIAERSLFFVFDGFDEVSPSRRDEYVGWIEGLRIATDNCSIVVTSRELTTEHLSDLSEQWQMWKMRPFDKNRISEYIKLWHENTPLLHDGVRDVDPEILARELSSDPVIKPLTSNPLLLSTLLMVHHLDGRLPDGRSQLYERYVDGMLGLWDDRRNVANDRVGLSLQSKKLILTKLALHFHLNEVDQLDEVDAISVVDVCCNEIGGAGDSKNILSELCERSGLIVGPGVYGFVHKSVCEYLVAAIAVQGCVCDQNNRRVDRFRLYENRNDDRWNVVIFLWAGLAPEADVEEFMFKCLKEDSFSLGVGLFADQINRFQPKIKNDFIIEFLSRGDTTGAHTFGFGLFGPKTKEIGPIIDSFMVRSLSQRNNAFQFVLHCIDSGLISVADLSKVNSIGLKDFLAIFFIYKGNIYSIECLDKVFSQMSLKVKTPNWSYWVALTIVERVLCKDGVQKKEITELYKNNFSDNAHYFLWAWMSYIISYDYGELTFDEICKSRIKMLSLYDVLNWDIRESGVLQETKSWGDKFSSEEDRFDLLSKFNDILSAYISLSDVSENVFETVARKVSFLIEARECLSKKEKEV